MPDSHHILFRCNTSCHISSTESIILFPHGPQLHKLQNNQQPQWQQKVYLKWQVKKKTFSGVCGKTMMQQSPDCWLQTFFNFFKAAPVYLLATWRQWDRVKSRTSVTFSLDKAVTNSFIWSYVFVQMICVNSFSSAWCKMTRLKSLRAWHTCSTHSGKSSTVLCSLTRCFDIVLY